MHRIPVRWRPQPKFFENFNFDADLCKSMGCTVDPVDLNAFSGPQ